MNDLKETLLDFRDDTLDFLDNYKIPIIGVLVGLLLIVIIIKVIIFFKIDIDIISSDSSVGNIVGANTDYVDLKAVYKNRNSTTAIEDITWSTEDGTLEENDDGTVRWYLPVDAGVYTITATNSDGYVGTKNVTILGSELASLYTTSSFQIIVNDSDSDGLTDIYESTYSKTSSTSKDTDGDGLYDGDEIILGYDPLKADSKSDGVKDGNRESDYTFTSDNVTITMHGTGNFTQTTIDKYTTETLENVPAVLDELYAFYTEANITTGVEISIKYSKSDVQTKGLSESSLAVYSLDEDNNSFSKLASSKINIDTSTVTFTVEGNGKYFIADSSKLTSNLSTEIVFLIDNSGSMYSAEEVPGSEENDVDFKRVSVVNDFIEELQGNYKFGAGKFTFEYTELISLTTDKTSVTNRVNSIKEEPEISFTGTNIGAAIEGGLEQFGTVVDNNRRYIILISDGADTKNVAGYDSGLLKAQLEVAKSKNVKIYTIGLGNVIDSSTLQSIADGTGGRYFFAATSDDFDVIFDLIVADLNYNLYDTDNDDIDDSVILYDSGFYAKRDGFPFSNFSNTQDVYGYGYGMALYAKLFYEGSLPDSLSAKKITTSSGEEVSAPAISTKEVRGATASSLRTYTPDSDSMKLLCELPTDFWSSKVSNGVLSINSKYTSKLLTDGFKIIQASYNYGSTSFSKYQVLQFSIDFEESTLQKADAALINVLARFDITKYRDEKFQFYDNNDTAFARLVSELKDGNTVMLRIDDDYTVLATKLLMDKNNMNKYKIEVYDPNYSGVTKYIEVERTKFSDIVENSKQVTDEYEYKFKYQGVDVGVCLSFVNIIENV